MHGNVDEWCHDWYGDYPVSAVTDPTGPENGANRVLRGAAGSPTPGTAAQLFATGTGQATATATLVSGLFSPQANIKSK
jgi:Formylglycine-generating sulfatase enzyme.